MEGNLFPPDFSLSVRRAVSYRENLAFMAHEVGAIYIDTYGTGKLKKELVNRDIVNSGCYILGAGVYPGLTGIAMNYLVKKYPSIKKWKGM